MPSREFSGAFMSESNSTPTTQAADLPQDAAALQRTLHRAGEQVGERSALVTGSGAALALLPWLFLAGIFVFAPPEAPVWSMLTNSTEPDALRTVAFMLIVPAVCTAAGFAVMRRWPGWRFYSGAFGWLCINLSFFFLTQFFADAAFNFASPPSKGQVAMSAAFALLAMLLLMAKRDEPPAKPFGLVTPIGTVVVLLGLAALVGSAFAPAPIASAIIGLVLVLLGTDMVFRLRGWRIAAGCLGWILIAVGGLGGLSQLSIPYNAAAFLRFWQTLTTALFCVALGHFVLWAKRREPKPKRIGDAAPAA